MSEVRITRKDDLREHFHVGDEVEIFGVLWIVVAVTRGTILVRLKE
jgi:hypothetical protein